MRGVFSWTTLRAVIKYGVPMLLSRSLQLVFLLAGCVIPSSLNAHPGGLDSQGCHTNRKTGEYHCHRAPTNQSAPPRGSTPAASDTYYRNCSEVRAAGKAPLKRGQPGYAAHLDRDGDGIACE
jgi:hypothetical protein